MNKDRPAIECAHAIELKDLIPGAFIRPFAGMNDERIIGGRGFECACDVLFKENRVRPPITSHDPHGESFIEYAVIRVVMADCRHTGKKILEAAPPESYGFGNGEMLAQG